MILLSGTWQDGVRLGLHDFAQYAGEVGWQVYDTVDMAFRNMADAVAEFAVSGKADFNDLANSIIKDLIRIYYQAAVLKPIAEYMADNDVIGKAITSLGGMFGFGGGSTTAIDVGFQTGAPALVGAMAKGGTIPSSNLTNTILTKPTLIPFAAGGVLAGEAGEEAVMPLTRVNGRLGVEARVGGVNIVVNNNAPGAQARVEDHGGMNFEVIVEQVENSITGRAQRGTGIGPWLDGRYRKAT
jgi:lambda family phage tail tape measure protein